VVLGEIGGSAEEELGEFLKKVGIGIPLVGFVAGRTAPRGKRLGHAGAILEDTDPGPEAKILRMQQRGYTMAPTLDHIPQLVASLLTAP
jgi:succinyl-CoA synthetase alpha subunit